MASAKKKLLKITLRRSLSGRLAAHKACVAGLGLRRIGHSVTVADTPEVRGMIRKVAYLLEVQEAKEAHHAA
jgi:large subunit ribosomal protein L30